MVIGTRSAALQTLTDKTASAQYPSFSGLSKTRSRDRRIQWLCPAQNILDAPIESEHDRKKHTLLAKQKYPGFLRMTFIIMSSLMNASSLYPLTFTILFQNEYAPLFFYVFNFPRRYRGFFHMYH
jgi:hypothetical protein